ncbi:MAG: hypothetical protein ACAI44_36890 [Candidatus Sericytochromatia bacterium]
MKQSYLHRSIHLIMAGSLMLTACTATGLPATAPQSNISGTEGVQPDSDALDNVNKGWFGDAVDWVDNAADDTVDVVNDVVDGVTDTVKFFEALPDTIDGIANDVDNLIEGIDRLITIGNNADEKLDEGLSSLAEDAVEKACDYVENNLSEYGAGVSGYFNKISSCSPLKDGEGYFLFGNAAGSGIPVWQASAYFSYSDASPRNLVATLQDNTPASYVRIENGVVRQLNTGVDKYISYFFSSNRGELEKWMTDLFKRVGPFAITGAYNTKNNTFTLYILKKNPNVSLISDPIIAKIKNAYAKVKTGYSLSIKEGSSITHSQQIADGNLYVMFYLFGTHQVKFDIQ